MQSFINSFPIAERSGELTKLDQDLKAGKVDILDLYKKELNTQSQEKMVSSVTAAITASFLGGAALVVVSTPVIAAMASALLVAAGAKLACSKRQEVIEALEDEDFGHLLTIRQLVEIEGLLADAGEPATPQLAASYKLAQKIVAEELEPAEDEQNETEAIDVAAVQTFDDPDNSGAVFGELASIDGGLFDSTQYAVPSESDPATAPAWDDEDTAGLYPDMDMETAQAQSMPTYELLGTTYSLFDAPGVPAAHLLALPLTKRAQIVLEAMDAAGANIGKYLNRPTFFTGGKQRCGKTVLLVIMAAFEKALHGRKIFYISADSETYPFAYDGIATGSADIAAEAFKLYAAKVDAAQPGELSGESWILDEFARTVSGFDNDERTQLWTVPLVALSKTRGKMRGVLHGKTAATCGVPTGWKETFCNEVIIAQGERVLSHDGNYEPTGKYDLLESDGSDMLKSSGMCISIPGWLKFEHNEGYEDMPCPVRSLLAFLPELDVRKTGFIPNSLIEKDSTEKVENTLPVGEVIAPSAESEQDNEEFVAAEVVVTAQDMQLLEKLQEEIAKKTEPVSDEPLIPGTTLTQSAVIERVASYCKEAGEEGVTVRGTKKGVGKKFRGDQRPQLKKAKSIENAMRFLALKYPGRYQIDCSDPQNYSLNFVGEDSNTSTQIHEDENSSIEKFV